MKQNKGVIGVGLVLAIVLGIVVVGGGAYYLGKSSISYSGNPDRDCGFNGEKCIDKNKNLLVEEEDKSNTDSKVVSDCDSNPKPSIKVISPNGGETYTAGQKITVKWDSCNIPKTHKFSIALMYADGEFQGAPPSIDLSTSTINDGIEIFDLKINDSGLFTIFMKDNDLPNGSTNAWSKKFTINSATQTSTISKNGITVTIPKKGFTYDTNVAGAAGDNAVALNIGFNNKLVISAYKWNNQSLFTESVPNGVNYQSVDMNYNVNGIPAQYYKFSEGGESFIVVPSKLTIIQVSNVSWIGITQSVLDQIITSIKIN